MAEPTTVPTADLLAKLNAAGVDVWITHPRYDKPEEQWRLLPGAAYWERSGGYAQWSCGQDEARNAVTVAALEVVREAANDDAATPSQRDTAYQEWCDLCNAPDLAAAAVEAACRVRGGA